MTERPVTTPPAASSKLAQGVSATGSLLYALPPWFAVFPIAVLVLLVLLIFLSQGSRR